MSSPKICFYCEKVSTDYASSGGDYVLRHFCVCRRCSELHSERRNISYSFLRPFDDFGSVLDTINKVRSFCYFLEIAPEDHPDRVWSLQEYFDLIKDLAYDYMVNQRENVIEDPKVAHAREFFYQALDRVRKNVTGVYEQISIPLPPPGARIKDRDPS